MALSFYNSLPTPELEVSEDEMKEFFGYGESIVKELDTKKNSTIRKAVSLLEEMRNELLSGQDYGDGCMGGVSTLINFLSDIKKINAEIKIAKECYSFKSVKK